MKDKFNLTIKEASDLIESGDMTATELTESCLEQIKTKEPEINAFITVTTEKAIEDAKKIDSERKSGKSLGKLAGIPYSLKDVFTTKGIRTTAGSKIIEDYIPPYNATVYDRLSAAGAVLVGKTNCDPFGFGSSTEYSAFGVTKNPHDTSRVAGGSSGGSGAAVAYGGGLFSIGEDTGGSIRCPASFCGIAGLKVTYGIVSRYGSIAYGSSYDSVGPMAKTVEDLAIILQTIAGHDSKDATSSKLAIPNYTNEIGSDIAGKTIGLPKEYFAEGLDPEVRKVIDEAVEKYKALGCEIKEVSLPNTKYAIAAYYIVGLSEASSNLARFDGIRFGKRADGKTWDEIIENTRGEGFSAEEKRRIMIGTYTLSAGYADEYYKRAQKIRNLIKSDFADVLNQVDIILTPTMPMPAFKIGENNNDPLKMWLADAFTVSLNPSGLPGLSVNAAKTTEGLPVGMQLIGKHFDEKTILNFGHKFEQD